MRVNAEAESGAIWSVKNDHRVTLVGKLIRRFRIDELPQLLNIIRGEMSIVGPRPERPEFVEVLQNEIPLFQHRHAMRPGLTGWAQLNYPYGASVSDAKAKLSYDLYYVKNASLLLDILIFLQTIEVVIWGKAISMAGAMKSAETQPAKEDRRQRPAEVSDYDAGQTDKSFANQ
jgi:lipopolysaccharide/colanic/teichoic acid biosynthesis glycosyltransferase